MYCDLRMRHHRRPLRCDLESWVSFLGRQGGNDRHETGSVSSQPNRLLINAGKQA